jgi:hypothetical protein
LKALDKGFIKWRSMLDFVLGKDRTGAGKDVFMKIFEDVLVKHAGSTPFPSTNYPIPSRYASPHKSFCNPLAAAYLPS